MTTDVGTALSRVVTFANGKGGAGKTSTAVNIAGLAAAGGWRTLLIDVDPQANAGTDLGYYWKGEGDSGQGLLNSLSTGTPLAPVLTGVRPDLDVISGGDALDDLESVITGRAQRSRPFRTLLAEALAPIAPDYDLIVVDTPPTRPNLLQLALCATRWIVVPTRADRASIEGLRMLSGQMQTAREFNPDLELLGAVLFDVSTTAKVVRANAADDIKAALDSAAPLLGAVIRHGESVASKVREEGLLVHELAEQVDSAEPYWKALRAGRKPKQLPGSAPALAGDYLKLCEEIMQRITAAEEQQNNEVTA